MTSPVLLSQFPFWLSLNPSAANCRSCVFLHAPPLGADNASSSAMSAIGALSIVVPTPCIAEPRVPVAP